MCSLLQVEREENKRAPPAPFNPTNKVLLLSPSKSNHSEVKWRVCSLVPVEVSRSAASQTGNFDFSLPYQTDRMFTPVYRLPLT